MRGDRPAAGDPAIWDASERFVPDVSGQGLARSVRRDLGATAPIAGIMRSWTWMPIFERLRVRKVTTITLDYRVSLLLIDPGDPRRLGASLILGVPFAYRGREVDAEEPSTMAECWRLLRRKIVTASADEDLNLSLSFDDGSSLRVDRNERYEAWELIGRGVRGVVVGPH